MVLGSDNFENSKMVFDLVAFHLHKKSSHGFSRLVCSGWEGCCLA